MGKDALPIEWKMENDAYFEKDEVSKVMCSFFLGIPNKGVLKTTLIFFLKFVKNHKL